MGRQRKAVQNWDSHWEVYSQHPLGGSYRCMNL
nr:MAG TPA: hypothetical protein [Caudoviricetes sp.]